LSERLSAHLTACGCFRGSVAALLFGAVYLGVAALLRHGLIAWPDLGASVTAFGLGGWVTSRVEVRFERRKARDLLTDLIAFIDLPDEYPIVAITTSEQRSLSCCD
jgi:hypothetical protein